MAKPFPPNPILNLAKTRNKIINWEGLICTLLLPKQSTIYKLKLQWVSVLWTTNKKVCVLWIGAMMVQCWNLEFAFLHKYCSNSFVPWRLGARVFRNLVSEVTGMKFSCHCASVCGWDRFVESSCDKLLVQGRRMQPQLHIVCTQQCWYHYCINEKWNNHHDYYMTWRCTMSFL